MTRCMKEIVECAPGYIRCILIETRKMNSCACSCYFSFTSSTMMAFFSRNLNIKLDISSYPVSSDKIRNWHHVDASLIKQHTSAMGRLDLLTAYKK